MANFGDHQLQIYLQGMLQGTRPEITTDLARLESQAAGTLSAEAMGYIVPSAGSGATARSNLAAFDRWRLVPRMLRGSTDRDLSCTILGTAMPAPVLVACASTGAVERSGEGGSPAKPVLVPQRIDYDAALGWLWRRILGERIPYPG